MAKIANVAKIAILLGLASASAAAQQKTQTPPIAPIEQPAEHQIDSLRIDAVHFDEEWNVYLRTLFGCPLKGYLDTSTCHPAQGTVDYAAFEKARKMAKKVFQLEEAK